MRRNDAPGTNTALEQLVKLNPTNKQYQELLVLLDKQIADAKKVGTLKPSAPQPSAPSSK